MMYFKRIKQFGQVCGGDNDYPVRLRKCVSVKHSKYIKKTQNYNGMDLFEAIQLHEQLIECHFGVLLILKVEVSE